jgi:hypothetical protein
VIARFDREPRETVDERVRALPNVAARSYRHEVTDVALRADGQATRKGVLHIVLGGRRATRSPRAGTRAATTRS